MSSFIEILTTLSHLTHQCATAPSRLFPLKIMHVLGIETSCDETGIGLYEGSGAFSESGAGRLLGQALYSQVAIHSAFGGVVPELASRDHVRKLLPLITDVLDRSGCTPADIDAVAYTAGPGLVGALMVGACFAHSVSFAWKVPCVPVHHMVAHLLAVMLEDNRPDFPFLGLLVSGGHTLLMEASGFGRYRILGESLDDAAGEAFDKVAKLLGLGYPGGPAIARLASQAGKHTIVFPRPLLDRPGLDFSFSGLKTAVYNAWNRLTPDQQTRENRAAIADAFEVAVVDTLVRKCKRALEQTGLSRLVVAGGVAANQRLRAKMKSTLAEKNVQVFYPRVEFCTDNGAMVAYAGWVNLWLSRGESGEYSGGLQKEGIAVHPRWPIASIE